MHIYACMYVPIYLYVCISCVHAEVYMAKQRAEFADADDEL